ncbi:allantoate amidohydrolase [Azospirillum sp. TSO22-1]|uniref:allantoate amidohydrolase n=1 Tax=Azospirillum sp. TSO22-1 TaxID=716789 RepID=UPI000D614BC8|nr:allantoate amidohydrolase [Azospirillum sp. TSO22-1]PWC31846.1 allantoate amidohydrolase [Azospirillum sp. TSO22-1]
MSGLMERLDAFAAFSAEDGALTRLCFSPQHRAAADRLTAWMREAGMAVHLDPAGTVVGRYEGAQPGVPALLLGSHIDTVRNAGKYDGNLGVLAAVEAVAELNRLGERLPFAVEVLGFGDEEGVRFPVTLTGSRAAAGRFDPAALEGRDRDGVRFADALAAFGGDPVRIAEAKRDALAYLEVHIEQGPVLEAEGLPLGIVTAINGATRFTVTVTGMAGHAGTVPMDLRRDALAAAAEMALAVEARGASAPGLVATVGRLETFPGAVNVIPGRVVFTVDVRASDDALRRSAVRAIQDACAAVASRRGVALDVQPGHDADAAPCSPGIVARIEAAVRRAGVRPFRLPSGAGHDAMAFTGVLPMGMLFVRCKGGISHNPAESITAEDADLAVRVLLDILRNFEPAP